MNAVTPNPFQTKSFGKHYPTLFLLFRLEGGERWQCQIQKAALLLVGLLLRRKSGQQEKIQGDNLGICVQ